MIKFERFTLDNGLRVIVHEDESTPMAVMNVLYDVGARDEDPLKTGFAHLFEHLMFGGSVNIPSYDEPLQTAGGENNAYTTNDITNYYLQLPAENLETAFWLESDRMLSLAFSPASLEVQRKVVSEEFKEHYINKPYGDVWHILRRMVYTQHPYRWMTIGAELSHIENASLQEVKDFFSAHYNPANAILVVAGNVQLNNVKDLADKWFGPIAGGKKFNRNLTREPRQTAPRFQEVRSDVPLDALYKVWHICGRRDAAYYPIDLITDILGGGASSRLFQTLVKEQQLFSNIDCYHFGSIDEGMLVIEGKVIKGIDIKQADSAVESLLDTLKQNGITQTELEKVKNKTESILAFEDMSLVSRAASLANYELLGDASLINTELSKYDAVSLQDISEQATVVFDKNNCSTLYYLSTQPDNEILMPVDEDWESEDDD